MKKSPIAAVLASAFTLAACQSVGSAPPVANASVETSPPAFVEAACAGCHSVEPPFLSPNPNAPSFESIANREGLTERTLARWLTDAHSYPEAMDFDLEPKHVKRIADYMITLRRPDYVPEP